MLYGLYALTDSRKYSPKVWPEHIEKIILGGANIIQLREKNLPADELLPVGLVLRDLCRYYGIPLIVNDHVELAKKINADGVHIGQHDKSLQETRKYLGNKYLIGVSCYKHLYNAIRCQTLGADYVAFGSVFSSFTKKQAVSCPLSIITKAKQCLSIPVCAIGGINHKNVVYVVNAGADIIATSHAIFNADDANQAANKIYQKVIMPR